MSTLMSLGLGWTAYADANAVAASAEIVSLDSLYRPGHGFTVAFETAEGVACRSSIARDTVSPGVGLGDIVTVLYRGFGDPCGVVRGDLGSGPAAMLPIPILFMMIGMVGTYIAWNRTDAAGRIRWKRSDHGGHV
ncbi:hypothetical protein AB0B31_07070 [Catellatospora citrea]|uniref:hypothetical protein n=1 Tax=Catellatospora citrea TaxID=53366 RepID=UPI0033D78694